MKIYYRLIRHQKRRLKKDTLNKDVSFLMYKKQVFSDMSVFDVSFLDVLLV